MPLKGAYPIKYICMTYFSLMCIYCIATVCDIYLYAKIEFYIFNYMGLI